MTCKDVTMINRSMDWAQVPQSKRSTWGISESGDHFYLLQSIKLCMFTKFHGCIASYMEATLIMCFVDWARVPQSKNSTRGISELGKSFYLFFSISNCVDFPSFMSV